MKGWPLWISLALLLSATDAFVTPNQRFYSSSSAALSKWPMSFSKQPTISSTTLAAVPLSSITTPETGSVALWNLFLETLIINGVPALFTILTIGAAAFFLAIARGKDKKSTERSPFGGKNPVYQLYDDLYGDQDQTTEKERKSPFQRLLGSRQPEPLPQNVGVPAEQYITLTNLNRVYDSYKYSMTAATQSKAAAAAAFRQTAFQNAWVKAVAEDSSVWRELQQAEAEFLEEGASLTSDLHALQTQLTQNVVDEEVKAMMEDGDASSLYQLDPHVTVSNVTANATKVERKNPWKSKNVNSKILELQKSIQDLELDFIRNVVNIVGPKHAASVRTALMGNVATRGIGSLLQDLQDRPLNQLLSSKDHVRPNLFVARFPGDATASQVETLREEVTAIVNSARPGIDEALIVLQTGGGTVTGYGLAAAQLLRLKTAGLKLTIAVEQVAASGGYMMCCVADHIVASPFAVLGSIGVITDIPNVYERLKKEGIEFQTVTAGKFKRTLTPTKKVSKEDFEKTKADVEEILVLFRDFVAENRPQLDIEKVATGETWFGTAALERKLCDEIKAVDDTIADFVKKGYNVFEIEYTPPVETLFGRISPASAEKLNSTGGDGLLTKGVTWLVRTVAREVTKELGGSFNDVPLQNRYMMKDDRADRIRSQD
ncbi:hypothetical protein FisN_7Lh071 [Fistulifera solaris]|uniref:Protease IV n=1 Tax=Fistulifera solaris TaxID=1519565 RepID=A0A1Z5JD66_FISSO|nr:hypothetical protein FisN_7Lh071 [Fistulifera solaris]|eukprot:GAX11701.1 hypothetical protein FisN_7Lh071 [Fistulifera solaris]